MLLETISSLKRALVDISTRHVLQFRCAAHNNTSSWTQTLNFPVRKTKVSRIFRFTKSLLAPHEKSPSFRLIKSECVQLLQCVVIKLFYGFSISDGVLYDTKTSLGKTGRHRYTRDLVCTRKHHQFSIYPLLNPRYRQPFAVGITFYDTQTSTEPP